MATESNVASLRKVVGLMKGCALKKFCSVGIRSLALLIDLSSSGESAFCLECESRNFLL